MPPKHVKQTLKIETHLPTCGFFLACFFFFPPCSRQVAPFLGFRRWPMACVSTSRNFAGKNQKPIHVCFLLCYSWLQEQKTRMLGTDSYLSVLPIHCRFCLHRASAWNQHLFDFVWSWSKGMFHVCFFKGSIPMLPFLPDNLGIRGDAAQFIPVLVMIHLWFWVKRVFLPIPLDTHHTDEKMCVCVCVCVCVCFGIFTPTNNFGG